MFSARKNKIESFRPTGVMLEEVDLLPDELFATWIEENTIWGCDFDPETDLDRMRQIWNAERVPGQDWRVTCRRRRKMSNGIHKREEVLILKLSEFPASVRLEQIVAEEGFGGGEFTVSSTRRVKVKHRFNFDGVPEDPHADPVDPLPAPSRFESRKEEIRARFIQIAMRYLEQNPEVGKVVALKILGKELGIVIPIPTMPDPSAPVPYADLSVEEQSWLDENPADKDFYLRRELGLDPPGQTFEERAVAQIKEKLLERIVNAAVDGPQRLNSTAGDVITALLGDSSLEELLPEAAKLWTSITGGGTSENQDIQGNSEI